MITYIFWKKIVLLLLSALEESFIIIFESPLPRRIQICKNIRKILKTKFLFKEILKCANSL